MKKQLAQVNIARLLEPLDSDRLAAFVEALDPVNAEADKAPGFVWRLQSEDGNATSLQAFEWDEHGSAGVITNMSVWESIDALKNFMYSGLHRDIMKQRREWFYHVAEATTVLWWIDEGDFPSIEDAESKIQYLRLHGPTPEAFTLNITFDHNPQQ